MTMPRLRSICAALALLCVLPGLPVLAEDTSGNPPMPQVVRGSSGHEQPAHPKPAAKPCTPTPEARAAGTVASGLAGTFAGSRWVTAPMSTEGAAAMIGAQQTYGCQR